MESPKFRIHFLVYTKEWMNQSIQKYIYIALAIYIHKRGNNNIREEIERRIKKGWEEKKGKGKDLFDFGEGEVESGVEPGEDLGAADEVCGIHHADVGRHRRRRRPTARGTGEGRIGWDGLGEVERILWGRRRGASAFEN